jgi:hypothetical protein
MQQRQASVRTVDLVTLKLQANKHPPLATSPQPVDPSASSANSSPSQTPSTALQLALRFGSFIPEEGDHWTGDRVRMSGHSCKGKSLVITQKKTLDILREKSCWVV